MVTKVSKTKYWIGRTIGILTLVCILMGSIPVQAQGPTYTQLNDVYYAVEGCTVYAEPTYTSTVLTTIAANVPVRVVGSYSNGWYRINIGVIAYCKMDSLTTAGDVGVITAKDTQAYYAKQTADQLGYTFHYMVLNDKKTIKKDIFNSYIGQKAILFAKIDDEPLVITKVLDKILGEKMKKKLYDHVREEGGRVPVQAVSQELSEIFTLAGEDLKN